MTPDPVSVNSNEAILRAAELLEKHNFRHLPVTDNSGHVIGMISDRDLVSASILQEMAQELEGEKIQSTVEAIMRRTVFVCQPGDTLAEAAALINQYRIGALPVIEDFSSGKLVGILSHIDLLRAFVEIYKPDEKKAALPAQPVVEAGSPLFDSQLIKRWEERLGIELPEYYKEVLSKGEDLIASLNYVVPYRIDKNKIVFGAWNNVLFAFETGGETDDYPVDVLLRDEVSRAERRYENFAQWHTEFEKASKSASFGG